MADQRSDVHPEVTWQPRAAFIVASLVCLAYLPLGLAQDQEPSEAVRPNLQVINGSSQPIEVFWLKSDTERISNGKIAPHKNHFIRTTIGHRFAIVGKDQPEEIVTSLVPIQAVRFDP